LRRGSSLEKRHREVRALVGEYVRVLRGRLSLRLLILFGSWAKATATLDSDVDVLVVADDLPGGPRESYDMLRKADEFLGINPLGYSAQAFLRHLEGLSFLLLEALEEGEVVYSDPAFIKAVRDVVEEVKTKHRVSREGGVWRFDPATLQEAG